MFEIREIKAADLNDLEKLYVESVRLNKEGFIQDIDKLKNIKDFVMDAKKNGGNFVGAFMDGKLVGFGGYIKESDERMQICKLHLHKDLQGMGLGKMLLSAIETESRYVGFKDLTLHVTATQKSAISLYQSMGYKVDNVDVYEYGENKYPTVYMSKRYNKD